LPADALPPPPGTPPAPAEGPPPAAFYFDLGSPLAYLAAERILSGLGAPAEWRPLLARELPGAETFEAFRCEREQEIWREEIERRARALDLQPLRWPAPFPFDSSLAMRVAAYARSIGRTVPFAQAAFRQAFAGGHSLADPDYVLLAAAACEMHPAAVLKAAEMRSVADDLADCTAQAATGGVREVPAITIGERLFAGERALEDAAAHLQAGPRPQPLAGGSAA
jgi:2-hydroxychromene-2-carboxylate isomerase